MAESTLTYRCPHCGTPMEVDMHEAGQTLTCPNHACGKPFRAEAPIAEPVPALVVPPGKEAPSPPPAAHAMPADVGAGKELQIVHLAMARRYPFRCVLYTLLIVAGLVMLIDGLVQDSMWLSLAGLVLSVIVAGRAILWWVRMRHTILRIATNQSVLENGLFSKESVEINHKDVTDLRVRQSTLGRLFHVGDVVIYSGGENKRIIKVMAVPNPEAVARMIRNQ